MLILKCQSCHGVKNVRGNNSLTVCVNSDGNNKWMLIVVGKSLKLYCFKNTKKLPVKHYTDEKAWINTAIFVGF